MKSLFQRPIIFATKYASGTLLAINSRYVTINTVNGMLKTGVSVYRDDSLKIPKFKRMNIEHLLTCETLPDKFRNNVKYNADLVSISNTSILHTTNKLGYTEHKLVDCITIPDYISHFDIFDMIDTDKHRALKIAEMIIKDPEYIIIKEI